MRKRLPCGSAKGHPSDRRQSSEHVPASAILVLETESCGQIVDAGSSPVRAVAFLADPEETLPDDKLCQSGAILVLGHFAQLFTQCLEGGIVDGLWRLHGDRLVWFEAGGLRLTAWLTLRHRRGCKSEHACNGKYLTDSRHRSFPGLGRARSGTRPRPHAQSTTTWDGWLPGKNMRSRRQGRPAGPQEGATQGTQQLTEQHVPTLRS